MHWAGMSKVPGGPMVCGACPTPEACAENDRCARASTEDYIRVHLMGKTEDEQAAMLHVAERLDVDGQHNVTGCPRFCRAMCSHRLTIKAMQENGTWPEILG